MLLLRQQLSPARKSAAKKTLGEASFFQDIVPGWNDTDFKGNFRVSRATVAYLVNELPPVLERQEFLSSSIQSPEGNHSCMPSSSFSLNCFVPAKFPKEPVLLGQTKSDVRCHF